MTDITLTVRGMDRLLRRITKVEKAIKSPGQVKRAVGLLLVEQTKRRIRVEKTSPDGKTWARWSPSYAATRSSGHSLLVDTGALLASIKARVNMKDGVVIESTKMYAPYVNHARPFLGISKKNSTEISALVTRWLGTL